MAPGAAARAEHDPPLSDVVEAAGLYNVNADSPPEALETALRDLARLLAGCDDLRRAAAKAEAKRLLKEARLFGASELVDAAFVAKRQAKENTAESTLGFDDPEPWPEAVDGSQLLAELARTFSRFLSLPDGAATAGALWSLNTYAHDAAAISPLLAITSPRPQCGKTTFLTLLNSLVARPLFASNVSASVVFRAIERFRPTLLVDEADTFLTSKDANEELRGILNSGHCKAAARVLRSVKVGDRWEVEPCSTWAAKAVALIGTLPPTLASRSIEIRLQRRTAGEAVERLRQDRLHSDLEPLRRKSARWALDNQEALRSADPPVPEELNERAADSWRPLLAIANRAGGEWPEGARKAARLLNGGSDPDDSAAVLLLTDLRELFARRGTDRLPSADVVAALAEMEERPWPEWNRGKELSTTGLARLLKPFSIHPKQLRFSDTATGKGYLLADCEDTFRRYLPNEPKQPKQSSNGAASRTATTRNGNEPVSVAGEGENPHGDLLVSVVSAQTGDMAREVFEL